jgi:hypothetical protein
MKSSGTHLNSIRHEVKQKKTEQKNYDNCKHLNFLKEQSHEKLRVYDLRW